MGQLTTSFIGASNHNMFISVIYRFRAITITLVVFLIITVSACGPVRGPLDTQTRTVDMGETRDVPNANSKIQYAKCTEPPPSSYNESVRLRLDAALKLSVLPTSDAAKLLSEFSRNIDSYFKTSQEGEDLKWTLFYICQISSARNFSEDVTIKLMVQSMDAYDRRRSPSQQQSGGPSSPNIIGDGNSVTYYQLGNSTWKDAHDNLLVSKIYINCKLEPLPEIIPPSGLRVLYFHATEVQSLRHITESGRPGERNLFVTPKKYGYGDSADMCRITNYSGEVTIHLHVVFDLEFHDATIDPVKRTPMSGAVKLKTEWPIKIEKIDPGIAGTYDFFLINQSKDYFLNVTLPRDVELLTLGQSSRKKVAMFSPWNDGLGKGRHVVQLGPARR